MPARALTGAPPDLLALHELNRQRYPYLLQSLGATGRWDILFAFPQQHYPLYAESAAGSFLSTLDELWGEASPRFVPDSSAADLPFRGGWFLFCGYELLHEIEPSVNVRPSSDGFPLAWLTRIPAAVMLDREKNQSWWVSEADSQDDFLQLQEDIFRAISFQAEPISVNDLAEEDPQLFLDGVSRIKNYITEGDVFQVNLARRWEARLEQGGAADLYAILRERNPAPFAGLADFGASQIISSSPERLARIQGEEIETRPIAGTHPRAASAEEDAQLRQALISSTKERAEHIMLVDLERNDLGRICQPGSVQVDELMVVQSYAHVHHIESSVRGRLRAGTTPAQVLRALFPGGTITGCPKVRTMQIIAELEASPRQAYTGSMGYLNHDGSMDLNILIRTFMLTGDQLSFKAGAGIVADSDPERELAETRAKAKGLLRALDASL
ncbi:MAG: aminodeoxychorismate synthase component I [Sulfurimicrobium sp.]|nr:aminodeoxychorismate synthase component I [Sulfurimicrobium sp.]MDO9191194.1 aminodeoxychorismate synthase component I [Sulfurimicrobium sp.]MDP1705754.1 aminodeoxychorismate synthase component I [Sulfurimicrobium sp.]MDP1897922.1 aminodeoxychorismate synthase component I [Sulfurimicrobium sp.]MDP2199753.1 aminodeoxychorismate synthase component I [Sulfurimicrobium sp.]